MGLIASAFASAAVRNVYVIGAGRLGREVAEYVVEASRKDATFTLAGFIDDRSDALNGFPVGGRARFFTLVHPPARVALSAVLGAGCVVAPFALVSASARLGEHVVLVRARVRSFRISVPP